MSNPDSTGETFDLERTWLVSVLFVDMVKYSQQSQEIQAQWRQRFKGYLGEGLQDTLEHDRVILDCGDGAAIVFLGEPESAMLCALSVMGRIVAEKAPPKPMRVRIGINLGSVKLVRDINGNMAAAGDGINVGQRVMSFATDNQILVSRSYYEVASLLTEGYGALFRADGVRKDKHQREHMLYELHLPNEEHPAPATSTQIIRRIAPQFAAQIATVEKNLALIVGPIARRLVQGAGQRARTAGELRDYLLAFVPDPADRERFLKSCEGMFSAPPTLESDTTITTVYAKPPPEKKPAPGLDPAIVERARKDLAVYMGPMAKLMVQQAAAKAQTRDALYQALAAEIPSAGDRERFLKKASTPY
jgi:class 3 adenylate cyclase